MKRFLPKCELICRQLHNNVKGEHWNFIYLLKNKLLPFAISISNDQKKLESNLVREMKDLYTEYYKTLPKKLKKAPIEQRHSCYWVIRFKIKTLKLLSYLHIPSNIYYNVLIEIEQSVLKFMQNHKRSRIIRAKSRAKTILIKKGQVRRHVFQFQNTI